MQKSDTRSGLEGGEQPITGWDPCIVRPPSHLKNARCAKLRLFVFCLVFFSWKNLLDYQCYLAYSFLFPFGSDDGKLHSFRDPNVSGKPWNLGRFTILLDREISGDLLSLICGTEDSGLRIYVVGVQLHAASCRGTEKVNYHIDRHDDTRCTIVTDRM